MASEPFPPQQLLEGKPVMCWGGGWGWRQEGLLTVCSCHHPYCVPTLAWGFLIGGLRLLGAMAQWCELDKIGGHVEKSTRDSDGPFVAQGPLSRPVPRHDGLQTESRTSEVFR